jgi:hypothetical protein
MNRYLSDTVHIVLFRTSDSFRTTIFDHLQVRLRRFHNTAAPQGSRHFTSESLRASVVSSPCDGANHPFSVAFKPIPAVGLVRHFVFGGRQMKSVCASNRLPILYLRLWPMGAVDIGG